MHHLLRQIFHHLVRDMYNQATLHVDGRHLVIVDVVGELDRELCNVCFPAMSEGVDLHGW